MSTAQRGLQLLVWLNVLFVAWLMLDQGWRLYQMFRSARSLPNGGHGVAGYVAQRKLGRWEIPRI
jgi:hypothetical protein